MFTIEKCRTRARRAAVQMLEMHSPELLGQIGLLPVIVQSRCGR
jgi:hypothetical protein